MEVTVDRVDLLEKVRQFKVKDDEVVKAVEEMKQAGVKVLRDKKMERGRGCNVQRKKGIHT